MLRIDTKGMGRLCSSHLVLDLLFWTSVKAYVHSSCALHIVFRMQYTQKNSRKVAHQRTIACCCVVSLRAEGGPRYVQLLEALPATRRYRRGMSQKNLRPRQLAGKYSRRSEDLHERTCCLKRGQLCCLCIREHSCKVGLIAANQPAASHPAGAIVLIALEVLIAGNPRPILGRYMYPSSTCDTSFSSLLSSPRTEA